MYGATTMQEPPALMYLPATPQTCALHSVFYHFLSYYIKQDADTIISHNKRIITLFNQRNIMSSVLSTLW